MNSQPTDLFWLPSAPASWSQDLQGSLDSDPEGRHLRGVCSARLNISQLKKVRSVIAAHDGASFSALRHVRLGLLGAGTLDFLADAIPGTAPRFGMKIDVAPVSYNAIVAPPFGAMGLEGPLDVVAILPDTSGFALPTALLDREVHDEAVSSAVARLTRIVTTVRSSFGCAVLLATIPADPEKVISAADRAILGSYSRFLADVNTGIADLAAGEGLALWDLAAIAGTVGGRNWRDPISLHVAKSPFSIGFAPFVADRLCAAIAPLVGKSRRALVLDLDNTLWGGVIGDDGLQGIVVGQGDAVGEAYLAVQRYALELRRRGIVLCVCSKNDDSVSREPFRDHPDMLLREEHIAIFQANWSDKATNLKTIADELALNLDSLVFLDDNPAERARVRQLFPEVGVPELPDDPAFFVACLSSGGYFETAALSADDLNRAEAYQGNAKRAEIRQTLGDYDAYLQSLDMTLTASRFNSLGRARITQLINKSNQFNLTTRRRQDAEVAEIEASGSHAGFQFRLADVFGDNGMISVVILAFEEQDAVIDTWLMSCRVLERGVEQAVLNHIVDAARASGASRLIGEYIPSPRNEMVREHYRKLGFTAASTNSAPGDTMRWELDLAKFAPIDVQMRIVKEG